MRTAVVRALEQRAFSILIDYQTWYSLTVWQRERIGPLSDRQARKVLQCENCVGWLENETREHARCGACLRSWQAVSDATIAASATLVSFAAR